jgi:hypothetical protein
MTNHFLIITLLVLLALPVVSIGQNELIEKNAGVKNIVGLKMGADDPWFGVSYERLLFKHLGAEVQMGLIGAALGVRLYIPAIGNGRLKFHVGVLPAWGFSGGLKTYFPIGINFLTKKSFRFSLDAGPRIWHDESEENFLGVSLRIGKGF